MRARLANPTQKLKPGLFASVEITLPGDNDVVVIPRSAVNYTSYGDSVFVVQQKMETKQVDGEPEMDSTAKESPDLEVIQRFVRLGEARGDFISVISGLKPGTEVASTGLLKLRNKQPVVIDNSNAPQPELEPQPGAG